MPGSTLPSGNETMSRAPSQAAPDPAFHPEDIDLLLVDDDVEFRGTVARRFMRRGFRVQEACNGEEALDLASKQTFPVAIFDQAMPGMSGIELLERFREIHPECEVILLTGQSTVDAAVSAMKNGAYDYLTKPFPLSDLELVIQRACERQRMSRENQHLKAVLERQFRGQEMIGDSPAMKEVFHLVAKAGPTDKAILIQGESGTGKELVAKALHKASHRANMPLVVINCAALPETLLESELFGHEKGAFTGAVAAKPGLFEVADGGTLFIDEIGEMPGVLQAKLLRVLENGTLRRVGSIKECRVNVRLLAATNRDLAKEVRMGRFREDLYYRINVMSLLLPPLRDRDGDIRLLVQKIVGKGWTVEPRALTAIERYNWPGNVRQLINAIERAKILSDDNIIDLQELPPEVTGCEPSPLSAMASEPMKSTSPQDTLADLQRNHVSEVLQRENWNKARAAKALGINRRSLYRLIEKYSLERPQAPAPADPPK